MSVTAVPLRPIAKGSMLKLWGGLAVAALFAGAVAWAGTRESVATSGSAAQFMAWHEGQPGVVTTTSGLQYKVNEAGEGTKPGDGDVALINYKGYLRDGTVFDQNERAPFPVSEVVPGFSEALKLMPKGAKYTLWIPPALGYGDQQQGDIPASSVIIFDVEMLDFRSQAEIQAMQMQMMQQQGAGGAAPRP